MKKTVGTMVAVMVVSILIGTSTTTKYATAGEAGRDGRFIIYENGTVLDTRTNLTWAAKDNGSNIDWANAKSYCENYRGGGYSDWRMPTQDELAGLYDASKSQQVDCFQYRKNHVVTDLIHITCSGLWGSETRGSEAATFGFGNGKRIWSRQSYDGACRALPVRSGKRASPTQVPYVRSDSDQGFTSPTIGAKFVLIPTGSFIMGSPSSEVGRDDDESPQHQVTISRSFYMQTTEVTQGQWKRVMGNNPSYLSSCGDDCPVEGVSWNDVQEFIQKLNSMEGTNKYRLPTEAQWEYAARAGTATRFYSGENNYDLSRAGWYYVNSERRTHPVGQKTPNAWGLYDIHGNVWEWVKDWMGSYPSGSVTDPEGPSSGSARVSRGGSKLNRSFNCRSAERRDDGPSSRYGDLGFRLIRTR